MVDTRSEGKCSHLMMIMMMGDSLHKGGSVHNTNAQVQLTFRSARRRRRLRHLWNWRRKWCAPAARDFQEKYTLYVPLLHTGCWKKCVSALRTICYLIYTWFVFRRRQNLRWRTGNRALTKQFAVLLITICVLISQHREFMSYLGIIQ